jgi:hypothetical protein
VVAQAPAAAARSAHGCRVNGDGRSLWAVFRWPAVVAAISIAGLLSALLGDGAWDTVSWAALAVPVALGLRGLVLARRRAG